MSTIGTTTPYHRSPVDLPKSKHSSLLPGALREDAMLVYVARDGRLYFRNRQMSLDQLPDQIRRGLRGGGEYRVYFYADTRVSYATVKAAIAAVRLAGVEHVSFITESPRR